MCAYYQSSQSNSKIIIVGKESVGKSTFIQRYLTNKYSTLPSTIVCDFFIKPVQYKNETIRLEIWDTAGQQMYENLISQFYRNTQAVIFAFNIADPQSLEKLQFWYSDIQNFFKEEIIKVVIATMCDLENKQFNNKGEPIKLVTDKQIEAFLSNKNVKFLKTSSQEDKNVKETFDYIVEEIFKNQLLEDNGDQYNNNNNNNNKAKNNNISLHETPPLKKKNEKKSKCCE